MSRLERPQSKSSNPATKFLTYKSETKNFEFWNKEKEIKEYLEAPLKFAFLEHYHTVKGWHDATQKGIVSNEVYNIGEEPMTVKTFGGLELGKGLYKDIKDKTKLSGGVYHRSIYVMMEDGTIGNLQLKGAVVGGLSKDTALSKIDIDGYSEFYKKNGRLLDNQWLVIQNFADAKKGATKFSTPIFEIGDCFTAAENSEIDRCAAILQDYINEYKGKKVAEIEVLEPVVLDDLDF